MIKVFVVDDSAVVRQTMQHLISMCPDLELLGAAPNPIIAKGAIARNRPDVLLLDIEMPGMDGLTFLRQVMESDPIPTVICSTLTVEGSRMALDALSAGAISVIAKPRLGLKSFLEESRRELLQALRTAALSRPRRAPASLTGGQAAAARAQVNGAVARPRAILPSATAAAAATAAAPQGTRPQGLSVNKPVVIGGSTGGTQAVEQVLTSLPADAPAIAVVLHMPEKFTEMYAKRLNDLCAMRVQEAKDGDRLQRGLALIAPGDRHLTLSNRGGEYYAMLQDGPPVNRHKPAVDVLFRSAAKAAGNQVLAMLLTGMGDDGARGLLELHQGGAHTIAQDQESCVVFGMPKEAITRGAASQVLPLDHMANAITAFDARG